jgi:hypothetical protein
MSIPNPLDLIRSRDGSMSLTKLGATTFHFSIALACVVITAARVARFLETPAAPIDAPMFEMAMWTLWASVAVGHAVVDKAGAQVAAYKDKQQQIDSGNMPLGPR